MAYSGGTFTRLYNWVDDRNALINITASRMDTEMAGMATGLSSCMLKDGTQIVTANIPMATFKFTGLGAGSAAGDSVRYEQVVLLSAGANQTITRSATGAGLTIESTEAGAARAPDLVLYRNSASPADADVGPGLLFDGEDSGGTQTTFGMIHAVFDDITDATEDGTLHFSVMTAGTLADELTLSGAALFPTTDDGLALGVSGTAFADLFLASGGVINFNAGNYTVTHSAGLLTTNGALTIVGALLQTANDGGALGASGTGWSDLFLASGAVLNFNAGNVTVGHAAGLLNMTAGSFLTTNGYIEANRAGAVPGTFNRDTDDGALVNLSQAGGLEGTISVSGTTVAYNTFMGAHWSQLSRWARSDILVGTVMESIDEKCEWPGERNDQLARCKVSDTPGSVAVYGVFFRWDDNDGPNPTNDMSVASLGAYVIRVRNGEDLKPGALLESAGDGTARPQADDVIRASTVAKVTAAVPVHHYDDGSFTIPCTLHCG